MLALLTVCCQSAYATTYYLDSTNGSDANSGKSISSPWKTLAKVNSTALKPGDAVLLKRSAIWNETLSVSGTGAPASPIVFDAYGSGNPPIISGADTVNPSLWRSYLGQIYVAHVGAITPPNQLYVDGVYSELARFPATGYLKTTSPSPDASTVIDSKMGAALNQNSVVGATIVLKTADYSAQNSTVAQYSPSGVVNVSPAFGEVNYPYNSASGYGFYFRNRLWMLRAPNQWFYDASGGDIYLWTAAGGSPAAHRVQISQRSFGINAHNYSFINVNNIEVDFPINSGISSYNSTDIVVNSGIFRGGQNGAFASGCTGCLVENSLFEGTLAYGVSIYGNASVVFHNTIKDNANVQIALDSPAAAIQTSGISNTISNNTIENSGSPGIIALGNGTIGGGSNIHIINNNVTSTCLKTNDCGAIYTWQSNRSDTSTGGQIVGNVVKNVIGNIAGTNNKYTEADGIYIDNGQHDFIIQNNKIDNADLDIFINGGYNNNISANLAHTARVDAVQVASPQGFPYGYTHNNIISGNVLESIAHEIPVNYFNPAGPSNTLGTTSDNIYCHPGESFAIQQQSSNNIQRYSLTAWQRYSGQDAQSIDISAACPQEALPKPAS
jgi:hypothetical protein